MGFLNRKLTLILFCLAFFATKIQGQCDLEIYDFNPETLDATMIVHNGYGCNPNDLTDDHIDKFILGITSDELQDNNFVTRTKHHVLLLQKRKKSLFCLHSIIMFLRGVALQNL